MLYVPLLSSRLTPIFLLSLYFANIFEVKFLFQITNFLPQQTLLCLSCIISNIKILSDCIVPNQLKNVDYVSLESREVRVLRNPEGRVVLQSSKIRMQQVFHVAEDQENQNVGIKSRWQKKTKWFQMWTDEKVQSKSFKIQVFICDQSAFYIVSGVCFLMRICWDLLI